MTDREMFDHAMNQCGFGCDRPRKRVRWLEILTANALAVSLIVVLSFIWVRFA